MKLRSFFAILLLAVLTVFASVHVGAESGAGAGLLFYVVLDAAVLVVASHVLGIRRTGHVFLTTNSLGTLAATGVFHDALALTLKRLPFISRLASDIKPAMGMQGMPFNIQQILKDYNAAQTVSDRATTGTYAKQIGQTVPADKTFTLNKWPYISFSFTLTELNQMIDSATNADARQTVISKLWQRVFNQFATNIVTDFLAIITAGNFSLSYVNAVGAMDFKKLGSAVDVFLQNDTLMQAPDAILEIVCFRELANSLTAVPNSSFNVNGIIQNGIISEGVSGANSATRYNLSMPADAARGVLVDPMAITFANRVPNEEMLPNDPVYVEIVTDPATGFSILLREAKDPMTGEVTRTITALYGFGIGLEKHLVRLIAA